MQNLNRNSLQLSHACRKKDSAEIVLARLLAVDLLPMYKLVESRDIQNGWAAQGFKNPTRNAVRKTFMISQFQRVSRFLNMFSRSW